MRSRGTAAEWRERSYFAQLDEAQLDAGIELTLDVCAGMRSILSSTTRRRRTTFRVAFRLRRHSNCRKDKADLFLPD